MKILVANVGSTSFKFRLYLVEDESVIAAGRVERVGDDLSPCQYQRGDGEARSEEIHCPDQRAAVEYALTKLTNPDTGVLASLDEIDSVCFKPVHAKDIAGSVFIDEDVIRAMEEYTFLAPAHNPPYIAAFRVFMGVLPDTPLVGVFEPAFHTTIPDYARTYGIPYEWTEQHAIRRYGFHGASHRFISQRVPELLDRPADELRIISCHMGGSSSFCAIKGGKSVETSMGFSPQSGLPNATRCGDLDPFITLYMMEKEGLSADELREQLSTNGGLKGISGLSGDVRDLEEAAAAGHARAELALAVLVHEAKKYIGAYTAVLGGLDVLAFTGGIGENSIQIRARICDGLECLGIGVEPDLNDVRGREAVISKESPVTVVVIPANEELILVREAARLLEERRLQRGLSPAVSP